MEPRAEGQVRTGPSSARGATASLALMLQGSLRAGWVKGIESEGFSSLSSCRVPGTLPAAPTDTFTLSPCSHHESGHSVTSPFCRAGSRCSSSTAGE